MPTQNTKLSGQAAPTEETTYPRPKWVPAEQSTEEDLCPDCFRVVGVKSRYRLVCLLGKSPEGMTVSELTEELQLRQPTVTHHLNTLRGVEAVAVEEQGRERRYRLNRDAHCFEECQIPY
ncbi:MAG: metalloregulator ArsR/SmtB family transcription factor [Spirochaetes bacterium]|nr:metalloregulator ArsR/SmtB family transcription factor [Spirochaetota bacterium]